MTQTTNKTRSEVTNPAWGAFFAEAIRLAELARERRAAREMEVTNENKNGNSDAVMPARTKT